MANTLPTSVWGVFKARSTELAKGNSGAALAITLAFVMPIYLMVIGIYGIGEVVRNKIEIQNAADAAAYSAAVVQADYLSRMATVNKAMVWTYVDLQKRSLDLAMDSFSAYVFAKFQADLAKCIQKNSPCHMHTPGINFNCGTDILVKDAVLNVTGCGVGIPELAKEFNGQGALTRFLLTQAFHVAVANVKGKGTVTNEPKVIKYSYNIIKMTKKLVDLRDECQKKTKETAQQIAIANMMECKDDYYVKVHMGDPLLSFFTMPGTEDNEKAFISFADPTLKSFEPKKVFGRGTDVWTKQKSPVGFWRVYQQKEKVLYAEWDWFWTKWVHVQIWTVSLHLPPITPTGAYDHGHTKIKGTDVPLIIKNNLPIGLLVTPAVPITLLPTFFSKSGTITVAIMRKTANPLAKFDGILSNPQSMTASGILSAFNPSVGNGSRPEFMCAIATARAGYKTYNKDKEAKMKSSDYNVGYVKESREKEWNLAETDWDGVMLPVKHAWDQCAGVGMAQTFVPLPGSGSILKDIFTDRKGWVDSKGKAADEKKLPEWDKLKPPGGLITEDNKNNGGKKNAEQKLDWEKLRDYLGH